MILRRTEAYLGKRGIRVTTKLIRAENILFGHFVPSLIYLETVNLLRTFVTFKKKRLFIEAFTSTCCCHYAQK